MLGDEVFPEHQKPIHSSLHPLLAHLKLVGWIHCRRISLMKHRSMWELDAPRDSVSAQGRGTLRGGGRQRQLALGTGAVEYPTVRSDAMQSVDEAELSSAFLKLIH